MTKPAVPSPATPNVVEIDAMDVAEWESGQRTPQASDANLAELVRRAKAAEPAKAADPAAKGRQRAKTAALVSGHTRPGGAPSTQPRTTPPKPAPRPTRARTEVAFPATLTPPAGSQSATPAARRPEVAQPDAEASAVPMQISDAPPVPTASTAIAPDSALGAAASAHSDLFETSTATYDSPARALMEGHVRSAVASSDVVPAERLRESLRASSPSLVTEPHRPLSLPAPVEPSPTVGPVPIRLVAAPPPADPLARPAPPPSHDPAADGMTQLPVTLTRRRLWWIVGALAGVSLAVVAVAAMIASPAATSPPDDPAQASPRPASRVHAQEPAASAPNAASQPGAVAPARSGQPGAAAVPARSGPPGAASSRVSLADRPARGDATGHVERSPDIAPAASSASHGRGKPGKRIAGKKLVIDYTARPSDVPPPGLVAQTEEDPAIGRARGAYTIGNQKLFAGDIPGAIVAYEQSLELYPGYVGGYRGLGLAYAEAGANTRAVAALKIYVESVPHARDVGLIKKRIARLQGR